MGANAFSSMGGTKLPVGVRHITVVIAVLMSFQRIAAEIEELHDADFHHATGWQEESGTPRADKVDKFEYPETRGSPRLCNTNECAIELSVVASYEKEHDPHDGGLTPLIEGQFGVVMHQSNGMKPKSIQGDAVHYIVEVEDDPFKCGRHPVELWQRTQDGTLSDFDFHPEESEMSKRYKEGMIRALGVFYRGQTETRGHHTGEPTFHFIEAKMLKNGLHRKWTVQVTNVNKLTPKKRQ